MEKERTMLQKSFLTVLQGIKSLTPTEPQVTQIANCITNVIVYQPVTINGCFQPLWYILGSLSTSVSAAFSKDTPAISKSRAWNST